MHKIHYQPKTVLSEDGTEAETQYGCYNFVYSDFICSPVMAYGNKWEDWTSF